MPEQTKKKKNKENRDRQAEKRTKMTEEEKEEEKEKNRKGHAKGRAKIREKRKFDGWSITDEELKAKLAQFKNPDDLFINMQQDPSVAVMLCHLNSGLFRFHQHRECNQKFDGEPVDEEELIREVKEEMLTDGELRGLLHKCCKNHSCIEGDLCSCGACGFRILEREEQPCIQCQMLKLDSAQAETLKCKPEDMKKFWERQNHPPIEALAGPEGDVMEVNIADLCSCCHSGEHGVFH